MVGRIVADHDSALLRYFADMQLRPGATLTLTHRAPFDGPITVTIDGREHLLGFKAASLVLIKG